MQDWRQVLEFPHYSVSDAGSVRNEDTGRMMRCTLNQRGILNVGLMKNGIQYKRSVALLVAKAFIMTARSLAFDTPINLDGDRLNNSASNIVWRPRWFALKYHKQFLYEPQGFDRPVIELQTASIFKSSWDAAITYGLLDVDVAVAIMNHEKVWPTYQRFRLLDD